MIVCTVSCALALVASPDGGRRLTFDEAIELSAVHPSLKGDEAALGVRRAEDDKISSLANDPQLLVMPGYRSSPSGSAGLEAQVTLSQSWSLAGLGRRRQEAASSERKALGAALRAEALTRRLDAARAWLDLRMHERDLAQVRRAAALAEALVDNLEAAAAAGVVLRTDLVEARAFRAELRAAQVDAEGEQVHAGFLLAEALGIEAPVLFITEGADPQPELPARGAWPQWIARASELPGPEQVKLTALAARAQAAEAEAEGGWTLQTQLSFQKESPTSYIWWGGLGVTPPVFDGARRQRARALATQARAEAEQAVASARAGRTVAIALHEVEHGRERLEVLSESLLPALEELVRLRKQAFEAGEGTALELLRAEQREVATARSRIRAEAELRWAEVQAWLLMAAMQEENR